MTSKLFQRGDHYVTVVTMKDTDISTGERKAFAIFHEPTGVQCAVTSLLAAAIRTTVLMDDAAEKAKANPDEADEPPSGGFGGGFGSFG